MADDPAYDQIIHCISGLMSITGDQGSAPLRVGYPLADTVGGMTAAFAVAAALNAKLRGTFLDISTTEAVLKTRPAADWAHELSGLGVPCAMIQSLPEALHSSRD